MLPHITTSINNSAKHTFGLKVKKKKKGMSLPKSILTKIKAKNQLARTLHIALLHQDPQADQLEHDHEQLKLQIRDNISDLKLQKRRNLRSKLLRGDPTRKRFWRFLKSQAKSAGSITALYKVITITLKHCITPKLSTLQDQNLRHTLYHFGLISRKKGEKKKYYYSVLKDKTEKYPKSTKNNPLRMTKWYSNSLRSKMQ